MKVALFAIAMLGVALLVLMIPWALAGLVLRRLERTRWAVRASQKALMREGDASVIVVGVAAAVVGCVFAIATSSMVGGSPDRLEVVGLGAAVVLAIFVSVLHRLPGSSRALKYVATLAALMGVWVTLQGRFLQRERADDAADLLLVETFEGMCDTYSMRSEHAQLVIDYSGIKSTFDRFDQRLLWRHGGGSINLYLPAVFCILVALGLFLVARVMAAARVLNAVAIRAGPAVFLAAAAGWIVPELMRAPESGMPSLLWVQSLSLALVIAYALTRYEVVRRAAARPLLYLRSFSGQDTARIYGRVVAPALAHHGRLVGLAHRTQTAGQLFASSHPTRQATLFYAPDEYWQDWVREQLSCARGVVIDMSANTPGVIWELEQATAHLPPDKIVIVVRESAGSIASRFEESALIVEASDSPASARQARKQLAGWARGLGREHWSTAWPVVLLPGVIAAVVGAMSLSRPSADMHHQEVEEFIQRYASEPSQLWDAKCVQLLGP